MTTRANPIRKRDGDGLMLDQRRLLQALASGMDPHAACRQEGITWGRFRHWIEGDEAFRMAFDNLVGSSVGTAREIIESMAVKATTVLVDALEAEKQIPVDVVCPKDNCGHKFTAYATVADMQYRMRAMENVLKSTEIIRDVRKTDVNVTHSLDLESMIALQRAKRGMEIPPHIRERFQQQGLLSTGEGDDVTEGEFREVEEVTP